MFVDAGHTALLSALAGGGVHVTPTVMAPFEMPPFDHQPAAEFARGLYAAQHEPFHPLHATRVQRRTVFYQAIGAAWHPVHLSPEEIHRAKYLASPAARQTVRRIAPTLKIKRVQAGEAEAAAVALTRGWTLWSDDSAIVNMMAVLYPGQSAERIGALLMRAAREGHLSCQEAADLYNDTFKKTLDLWSTLTLVCRNGQLIVR